MGNIESNNNFTSVCLDGLVISGNNIHMRWTEEHYLSFFGMYLKGVFIGRESHVAGIEWSVFVIFFLLA